MSEQADALKGFRASLHALSRTVREAHSPDVSVQEGHLRTMFVCAWLGALTRESYADPFQCISEPPAGLGKSYESFVSRLPETVRKELPIYVSHGDEPMFNDSWTRYVRNMSPIVLVRGGYETAVAETLSNVLDLRPAELLTTIGIPERTVSRRLKEHKKLTSDESDRLYRALDVTRSAVEVFGDSESATKWLKEPNPALGGVTPLSLLDTEPGRDKVSNLLVQIDHGVYA